MRCAASWASSSNLNAEETGGGRVEVAGVDGCRAGWLVVRAGASERLQLLALGVERTFDDVIRTTRQCAAVAVDIPIGLSDGPPRTADRKARRVLGWPRGSSVFPAPIRPVLEARTYEETCAISFRLRQKKISKQAYNILAKIREADRAMTPDLQERVVETHPEVSFWALNGQQPLGHGKKAPAGAQERVRLLSQVFRDDLASVPVPAGAGRDDFYDACAAAWTAWRLARGSAHRLPTDRPLDSRGLRMEIVY